MFIGIVFYFCFCFCMSFTSRSQNIRVLVAVKSYTAQTFLQIPTRIQTCVCKQTQRIEEFYRNHMQLTQIQPRDAQKPPFNGVSTIPNWPLIFFSVFTFNGDRPEIYLGRSVNSDANFQFKSEKIRSSAVASNVAEVDCHVAKPLS